MLKKLVNKGLGIYLPSMQFTGINLKNQEMNDSIKRRIAVLEYSCKITTSLCTLMVLEWELEKLKKQINESENNSTK